MKPIALVILMLSACGSPVGTPEDEPAAPTPTEAAPAEPEIVAKPAVPAVVLPGEWRVAGVDGGEIDQPYAITASITADHIHVTADCLNFAWSYVAEANRIATERVAVESCGRGPTAPEEAVVAAIDAAEEVARTPANAVELRGSGRVVTLFSQ